MANPVASGGIVTPLRPVPDPSWYEVGTLFGTDPVYTHDEITRFAWDFYVAHIEHRGSVRVMHVSYGRVSLCCDHCNMVRALSLDNRRGVK